MEHTLSCNPLEEVRAKIDEIDRELVTLIAKRGALVKNAAKFKKTTSDVKAPQRVEQVVEKAIRLAENLDANTRVVENVYRTMISSFIEMELLEHESLQEKATR